MTRLGKYLPRRSVNRAAISRKTKIHTTRLNELSDKESARLTAEELYLIALAIEAKADNYTFLLDIDKSTDAKDEQWQTARFTSELFSI